MGIRVFYTTEKVIDRERTGRSVRQYRIEKGRTLREVGKVLGVGVSYLCDLEHGRKPWNPEMVEKVGRAIEDLK